MSAASTRLKSLVSPAPFPSAALPSTREEADKQQLAPQDRSPDGFLLPKTSQLEMLKGAVPLSSCEDCSVGGEGGEEEYDGPMLPSKFEVDLECEMLGSGKPLRRLTLLSGAIIDKLPKDIIDDQTSLAFYLSTTDGIDFGSGFQQDVKDEGEKLRGVYEAKDSTKMQILASNVEVDTHDGTTSAMVFPDYKYVEQVSISREGALTFYQEHLNPSLGRSGAKQATLKSWVLPYKAVILLCAHKARDKKCAIAAPLLETVLTSTLSSHGVSVDNTGASLHHLPSTSSIDSYPEESREASVERVLREISGDASSSSSSSEVGLFRISHLSGHKFSGVMIIAFPTGAMLYYGRVTPKKCIAIVEETILKGKILPEHLRAGLGVRREEGKTLLDW